MSDKSYNGWTNYATWRVNLELFDQYDWLEEPFSDQLTVGYLEELVENWIFDNHSGHLGLIEDYARAFVSQVNYYEILEHIKEELSNENEAREFLNKKENE